MSLGKPTIKLCFMDDEMRDFAINEATKALETSNSEKVSRSTTIAIFPTNTRLTSLSLFFISWLHLT